MTKQLDNEIQALYMDADLESVYYVEVEEVEEVEDTDFIALKKLAYDMGDFDYTQDF